MARNRLQERDNSLPPVEYDPLLKVVLEVLKKNAAIFTVTPTVLQIEIERLAQEVVKQVRQGSLNDIRPFIHSFGTTHVAAHFLDGEAFNTFGILIERIRDQLASHLKTALAATLPSQTLETYLRGLVSDSQLFTSNHKGPQAEQIFALTYPFKKPVTLKRRRLHLQARSKPGRSDVRLLGHKLTITVRDMNVFEKRLVDALCSQVEESDTPPSAKELERIRAVLQQRLQDESSELGTLKRILTRESLGRLQKEAKILYLDYIARALSKKQQQPTKGLIFLQTLSHRLRLLEAFLHQDLPDDYYQVSYHGQGANYRSLFSRSEVLDLLPIFTDIEGTLGETYQKEKGEQEFTLGVKLKLNGPFRTYPSVFDYYRTLLDPASPEHKERVSRENIHQRAFIEKVLKMALLYYFAFKKMDDPLYDPSQDVETELLAYLRGNEEQDQQRKQQRLGWLKKGLEQTQVDANLKTLREELKTFVKSAGSEFEVWPTSLYLSISADIIDPDEDRMREEKKFFWDDALGEKGMRILKYITVGDASAAGNTLCSLPVSLTFEPLYYYSTEQAEEQFSMTYQIGAVAFLPIIFLPTTDRAPCQEYYKKYKHIEIPYAPTLPYTNQGGEVFVYHFTYLLLSYLSMKMLSEQIVPHLQEKDKRLFLPIMRIHRTKKAVEKEERQGEEEFLRALSKTLSHSIREHGMLSNAQGLYIESLKRPKASPATYTIPNALSSLYSILPKVFTLPAPAALENLAVIVVSSRKCDAHKDSPLHLSTIYGEAIGIRRIGNSQHVRIVPLDTFSANEASDNMYRTPTVLQDQAKKCYMRGYRHILYVAQAPYSSSLHLTSAETAEEQFFMSSSIIESLKGGRADLHIYPVYCDKFYVVKVEGNIVQSLYVDDTSELRSLVNDPTRSAVVFFNLLNGIVVGNDPERLYNGVVSYATLINVYDDPIYDQNIRNHLLDASHPGSLKQPLLDYLTLLHFARYERNANTISMKLDPYEEIIGSDSVGTLSMIDHMNTGVQFNMLAFLAEVRNVLNREYSGYVTTLLGADELGEEQTMSTDASQNGDDDGGAETEPR